VTLERSSTEDSPSLAVFLVLMPGQNFASGPSRAAGAPAPLVFPCFHGVRERLVLELFLDFASGPGLSAETTHLRSCPDASRMVACLPRRSFPLPGVNI